MPRKKLKRFAALPELPNFRDRDQVGPGGDWLRDHFGVDRPVILELGCGKGEYSLALAEARPDRSVIGVDRKGDRLWCGATAALARELPNAVFLRTDALDLRLYLNPGQVESIWLPYPDPLPRRRHAKHRLLSTEALESFRCVLLPGGLVHLKTDDVMLVEAALDALRSVSARVIRETRDLYSQPDLDPLTRVPTNFERRHLARGRRICYLEFDFSEAVPEL